MNESVMTPPEMLYESKALRTVTGPAIRPGGLVLTERALAFCALSPGTQVLDVGCGSGATVAHVRQAHGLEAVGLDLSPQLLSEGRAHSDRLMLIQGRAEAIPIADRRFSAVFCECVLSLLKAPEAALAEWQRVLTPGGYLILSDLYDRSSHADGRLFQALARSCLAGAVGRRTLHERMERAGFEVLLFEDHTPLLTQLVAKLVWAHGSLEAFWSAVGGGCGKRQAGGGQPGYYLMVACKGADEHG